MARRRRTDDHDDSDDDFFVPAVVDSDYESAEVASSSPAKKRRKQAITAEDQILVPAEHDEALRHAALFTRGAVKDAAVAAALPSSLITKSLDGSFQMSNVLLRRYLVGDTVHLGDTSTRLLAAIASYGAAGVTQADLAKQESIDPRSLFHYLKPVIRANLVVKSPVSYNRTFTYRLVYTPHAPQPTADANDQAAESRYAMSTVDIRTGIVKELAKADALASTVRDRIGSPEAKSFRRGVRALLTAGIVTVVDEVKLLGGDEGRILHLEVPLDDALRVISTRKTGNAEDEASDDGESSALIKRIWNFAPSQTFAQQVETIAREAGATGVTLAELSAILGISSKALYRRLEGIDLVEPAKLATFTRKRPVLLLKTSEFVGRQRRLRLFYPTSLPEEATSGSQAQSSAAGEKKKAGGVTPAQRQDALLKLLAESPTGVLEVNKQLCRLLKTRLADDSPFEIDSKTVQRSTTAMYTAGLLGKRQVVTPRAQTRTFIFRNDTEGAAVDAAINSLLREKSTLVEEAQPVDEPTPAVVASVKKSADSFGFVDGVMVRAQILAEHISTRVQIGQTFSTVDLAFKGLPFRLFRQLVGMGALPEDCLDPLLKIPLPEIDALPISALPANLLALVRNRLGKHRQVVRVLLGILDALGTVTPVNASPDWRLGPDALALTGIELDCPSASVPIPSNFRFNGATRFDSTVVVSDPVLQRVISEPSAWNERSRDPIARILRDALKQDGRRLTASFWRNIALLEDGSIDVDAVIPDEALVLLDREYGRPAVAEALAEMRSAALFHGRRTPSNEASDSDDDAVDIAWTETLDRQLVIGYYVLCLLAKSSNGLTWSLLDAQLFAGAPKRSVYARCEDMRRHLHHVLKRAHFRRLLINLAHFAASEEINVASPNDFAAIFARLSQFESVDESVVDALQRRQAEHPDRQLAFYASMPPLRTCSQAVQREFLATDPPRLVLPRIKPAELLAADPEETTDFYPLASERELSGEEGALMAMLQRHFALSTDDIAFASAEERRLFEAKLETLPGVRRTGSIFFLHHCQ